MSNVRVKLPQTALQTTQELRICTKIGKKERRGLGHAVCGQLQSVVRRKNVHCQGRPHFHNLMSHISSDITTKHDIPWQKILIY